jgi:hypothetical protein
MMRCVRQKNVFQLLAVIGLAMKGVEDVPNGDEMEFPIVTPGEILLGDLPPQTGIAAEVGLVMAQGKLSVRPASPAKPTVRTTLNLNAKHPLLQVSKERHTQEWKTHVVGLRRGDPLAFTFYFKNTGRAIARDVSLRLQLQQDEHGIVATGSMTAANADALAESVRIEFERPGALTLFYDRTEIYRHTSLAGRLVGLRSAADAIQLGDLDPGEWGLVKIIYVTAPDSHDLRAECASTAVAGKRIEFTIAIDNPHREPLRDVALRVHLDQLPRNVRSTLTLSANESQLVEHTYQASTLGEQVVLRYRDAQVYTTTVGRHIDARKATESAIAVGDVPSNGQLFVRLTYDVMAKPPEGCSGTLECPGVECVSSDLCQF